MARVLNKYKLSPGQTGVYIGRPSVYRNRFPITTDADRDEVCDRHILYMLTRPDAIAHVRTTLPGKDVICFCAPKRCHGDFLVRLANEPTDPFVIAEELLRTSVHWEENRKLFFAIYEGMVDCIDPDKAE